LILGTLAGVYVGYRALVALLRQKGINELSQRSKIILVIAIFLAVAGAIALSIFFSY
jgi:flagellar biosynthesis/type III secretory pathway M-ring protein FliF/YscJ